MSMYPGASHFSYADEELSDDETYQRRGYCDARQYSVPRHSTPRHSQQKWPQRYPYYNDAEFPMSPPESNYVQVGNDGSQLMEKITKLMETQEALKGMLVDLTNRVTTMEHNRTTEPHASTSVDESKKRITRSLTTIVSDIHDSLDEENQFKLDLRLRDPHNKMVCKKLEEEVLLKPDNPYGAVIVKRSTKRLYEQRRRTLRESDPSQRERVLKQERSRKIRSRKDRLYKRRENVALEGPEKEKLAQLGLEYISQESSCDEEGVVHVHQPEWRSQMLSSFFNLLDNRADENRNSFKKHTAERKKRVIGTPLKSVPPPDAPSWSVSSDWLAQQDGN